MKLHAWLATAGAAALLAACATAPAPQAPVTLRVIAFNDLHGNLESAGLVLPPVDFQANIAALSKQFGVVSRDCCCCLDVWFVISDCH